MNKTIAKVGFAPLTFGSDSTESYDDVKWFDSKKGGGREVTADPNGESFKIYADGIPAVSGEDNAGYNIKLQLIAILDYLHIDWFGFEKTAEGAIVEKADAKERPRFALFVAKERYNADTKYEVDIYLNCIVSKRPGRNDKTSEGKFDPQFPDIEISSEPRISDKVIRITVYTDELPTEVPDVTTVPATPTGEE